VRVYILKKSAYLKIYRKFCTKLLSLMQITTLFFSQFVVSSEERLRKTNVIPRIGQSDTIGYLAL